MLIYSVCRASTDAISHNSSYNMGVRCNFGCILRVSLCPGLRVWHACFTLFLPSNIAVFSQMLSFISNRTGFLLLVLHARKWKNNVSIIFREILYCWYIFDAVLNIFEILSSKFWLLILFCWGMQLFENFLDIIISWLYQENFPSLLCNS